MLKLQRYKNLRSDYYKSQDWSYFWGDEGVIVDTRNTEGVLEMTDKALFLYLSGDVTDISFLIIY